MLGEVIAWRNLFWAISDAMAMNPMPWVGDAVLPNAQSGSSYRVFAGDAYGRIKEIVEKIVASALIYLPSSAKDFANPDDRPVSGAIRARLERHRLPRAHQDHEAAVGRDRHRVRRPPRALRAQLRRQPRGHPHPVLLERARLGRARRHDRRSPSSAWRTTTRTAGRDPTWLNPDDVAAPPTGTARAAE